MPDCALSVNVQQLMILVDSPFLHSVEVTMRRIVSFERMLLNQLIAKYLKNVIVAQHQFH